MELTGTHEQDRLMNRNGSASNAIPDPLPAGPGDSTEEQQDYRLHPDRGADVPIPAGPPDIPAENGNQAVSGVGELIKRRSRPFVAIREAQQMAMALGFAVIELVMEEPGPFDFAIHDRGVVSLVRVRRLRQNEYRIESIIRSCAREIREFRDLDIPGGIGRELWVRGPQRAFRRYRITPETIEAIPVVPRSGLPPGETGTHGDTGFTKTGEPG
jgi:hypothetical protein